MTKIEEDTWMNPSRSAGFEMPPPKNGTFHVIERKRMIPVSGNVSAIGQWDTWQEFSNKDERDTELKRLRNTTTWVLRARTHTYVNGQSIGFDPSEYADF